MHSEDRRRGDTIAEWFPFKPCALVSFAYQLDTQVTEITQFILGQTLSIQRARLTHTVAQRLLVLSFFLPNKANLIPADQPGCVDPPEGLPRGGLLRNTPVAYCRRIVVRGFRGNRHPRPAPPTRMLRQPVRPQHTELGVSGSSVPPYAAAVVLRAVAGSTETHTKTETDPSGTTTTRSTTTTTPR